MDTRLRVLCFRLLNGGATPEDLAIAVQFLDERLRDATGRGAALPDWGRPWTPTPRSALDQSQFDRHVLTAWAPSQLLSGVWLSRAAQPANGHRESESHLLALHNLIMGLKEEWPSEPATARARLQSHGVHLPELHRREFFLHPAIPDFAWRLPLLHLALLHRPRSFLPELVGYSLAHVCQARDEPANHNTAPLHERALAALNALGSDDDLLQRAATGYRLYRAEVDKLRHALAHDLSTSQSPAQRMARVIETKRSHAHGYHQRVILDGQPLDAWFAKAGSAEIAARLAQSEFADSGCPVASRLFRATEFGGPMFGVFDAGEQRLIADWMSSTESVASGGENRCEDCLPAPVSPAIRRACLTQSPPAGPELAGRRRLFHQLLNAESPIDARPFVEAAIAPVRIRARWMRPFFRDGLPDDYSPAVFSGWVEAHHAREVVRYRPPTAPPRISKPLCRWLILQLAPAILADGAWLAGVGAWGDAFGIVGRNLLRIYSDELGDGRADHNHPNVYRHLLDQQGLEIAEPTSAEFAADRRFVDSAFDIPNLLLAFGWSTSARLPELLGLNLAIELSGLGAGYRQAIDILRYHQIDPAIVELHLSIDNLSSGHSRLATQAIVAYLDDAGRYADAPARQAIWRRVVSGYRLLACATLPLALSTLIRYRFDPLPGGRFLASACSAR